MNRASFTVLYYNKNVFSLFLCSAETSFVRKKPLLLVHFYSTQYSNNKEKVEVDHLLKKRYLIQNDELFVKITWTKCSILIILQDKRWKVREMWLKRITFSGVTVIIGLTTSVMYRVIVKVKSFTWNTNHNSSFKHAFNSIDNRIKKVADTTILNLSLKQLTS